MMMVGTTPTTTTTDDDDSEETPPKTTTFDEGIAEGFSNLNRFLHLRVFSHFPITHQANPALFAILLPLFSVGLFCVSQCLHKTSQEILKAFSIFLQPLPVRPPCSSVHFAFMCAPCGTGVASVSNMDRFA